jgi:hypothetical protein
MTFTRNCLMTLCLLFVAAAGRAENELDGDLAINASSAAIIDGVVQLNAETRYPLTDRIREALQDGVTLAFELEVVVSRPRRFWLDANLVEINIRRELSYHLISERYVVTGPGTNEQLSFPTLEAALEQLGHVENFPVAVKAQLRGDGPWEISVRAGIRRGRIPDTLRSVMFWSDSWHRTTEWKTWSLTG